MSVGGDSEQRSRAIGRLAVLACFLYHSAVSPIFGQIQPDQTGGYASVADAPTSLAGAWDVERADGRFYRVELDAAGSFGRLGPGDWLVTDQIGNGRWRGRWHSKDSDRTVNFDLALSADGDRAEGETGERRPEGQAGAEQSPQRILFTRIKLPARADLAPNLQEVYFGINSDGYGLDRFALEAAARRTAAGLSATGSSPLDESLFPEAPPRIVYEPKALIAPMLGLPRPNVYDPWEEFNRRIEGASDHIDDNAVHRVVRAYKGIPRWLRDAVTNFFENIRSLDRAIYHLIQLSPRKALIELGRFIVNTFCGPFGFRDVAESGLGWKMQWTNFSQTLAAYGVPEGPYIRLPFAPPMTLRDIFAEAATVMTISPYQFLPLVWNFGLKVLSYINKRSRDALVPNLTNDRYRDKRDVFILEQRLTIEPVWPRLSGWFNDMNLSEKLEEAPSY